MSSKRNVVRRTASEQEGVVIAKVLSEVQRALYKAQMRTAGSDFPQLEAVTVTLQTVIVKTGGGKIKFLVFSFGKTWEKERSHEMVLSLKPLKPTEAHAAPVQTLAEDLENAIVDAAQGVKDAVTGTPPLLLNTFKLSVSFVVTENTSAGGEFTIAPITFELKGNLKTTAIHKIELSFKR